MSSIMPGAKPAGFSSWAPRHLLFDSQRSSSFPGIFDPPWFERVTLQGGAWTLINFYWAFVLLPLADIVVGVDTFNKRDEEYKHLRER